jgi:hypothetical protein
MFKLFDVGTKVSGTYYGIAYSGIVRERRPHSINNSVIHFVDLDNQIEVYGDKRMSLCVSTGEPKGDNCTIEISTPA